MADTAALMGPGKRGDWETPPELFRLLHDRYRFDLDVAASAENTLCARYIGAETNALTVPWLTTHRWWCNPPYGHGALAWVDHALEQRRLGCYGVMLLPSRTDTRWYHRMLAEGIVLLHLAGRLTFNLGGEPVRDAKGRIMPAPFPSLLADFGPWL
ncbi:MAG TPA: DNA N-6-adenine-methyltransferase [Myxococcota bacterium]